jgi:CRISPR/Cas system endoribonuclease Cas6 (RAMP superfamily)
MKFGGLLGEIRFQGNLQPFIPYLQMGEWCHIGGKTSFGLGKYRLNDQATSA